MLEDEVDEKIPLASEVGLPPVGELENTVT